MNFFTLAASLIGLVAADHTIELTTSVDNAFYTDITGGNIQYGPGNQVGTFGPTGDWTQVQTKTYQVTGDGPWVLGVVADDYGVTAGFMGVVRLDGEVIAVTGDAEQSWQVKEGSSSPNTLQVPPGWLAVNYDAAGNGFVPAGFNSACLNQGAYVNVKAQIGQGVKPIWQKGGVADCTSYPDGLHYYNYFRLVISLPPAKCEAPEDI
ncbi:hypothetical protein BC833DRAFT_582737 [Globomyces pollinis-pini]|nr:hypothetical protein BC833DRAFT_582737 [Globomyces pollinis-pini]